MGLERTTKEPEPRLRPEWELREPLGARHGVRREGRQAQKSGALEVWEGAKRAGRDQREWNPAQEPDWATSVLLGLREADGIVS